MDCGASKVPTVGGVGKSSLTTSATVKMGWALKSTLSRHAKFIDKQKQYLNAKFQIGERTGKKADPTDVSKAMRTAKDSNGERLFCSSDFLTSQQISSYFSRLTAEWSVQVDKLVDSEDETLGKDLHGVVSNQEPITRSLHLYCTLESTLSNEELFLEQAFPRKSSISKDVNVNEHDWAAHWLVDWLLRIRAWQILRTDRLIGYYALVRDKFCPKTVSINNFSSERVDSEGLYGRWRLRVMGSCSNDVLSQVSIQHSLPIIYDSYNIY